MTQQQWTPTDDEAQMPLGVGETTTEAGAEEKKRKVSGPTFILFGAFASALAVIYLLGMQSRPRAASAEQMANDEHAKSAITELLEKDGKAEKMHGLFKDTDKMVGMFYSYLGTQKSRIPQLSHDPLGPPENPAPAPSTEMEAIKIVSTDPAEAEKLRQVAVAFSGLKLQSVLVGKNSIAMINNKLVEVGNRLGDLTVVSIESERVLLSYGKNVFELKLNRPGVDK